MGKKKPGFRIPVPPEKRCKANTKGGQRCKRGHGEGEDYCPVHIPGQAKRWAQKGGRAQAEHWKKGNAALAKWPVGADWNGSVAFLDRMVAIELETGERHLATKWYGLKVKSMEARDKLKTGGTPIIIQHTDLADIPSEEEREAARFKKSSPSGTVEKGRAG